MTNKPTAPVAQLFAHHLRIAFCVPEIEPLQQAMQGKLAEAAYLQQTYIATGLQTLGHSLTFVAPYHLDGVVCTDNLERLTLAPQSWSAQAWFQIGSKSAWQLQRRLGMPYLNLFSNYRRFDACLRCLPGQDLVYERNGLYNVGVAMACKRLKLPYVLFFDADQLAEHAFVGKPITGLLRWRAQGMLRYNLNAANGIICVSAPARRQLITNWGVPAEKIVVFANGVDINHFRPDPAASAAMRTALGVTTNPLVIFVGNFYEWHDTATLLDAFAQVLVAFPLARLLLVGDGPQRPVMMQRASALGITHAVHFTGLVEHAAVPQLLAAADVAVVPVPRMDRELWLSPMKLFEYMAAGLAIVASAVGQLANVLEAERNGCLVPPGDVALLATTLQRLLGDPALRARLGQQARADAVDKYAWTHYLSRLEKVFRAVIAQQPIGQVGMDQSEHPAMSGGT